MSRTYSATLVGIDGALVEVEAVKQKALPKLHVTGLPGDIVRESCDRVRACLAALGFDVPTARITVNLSPADAKKQGGQFDLAIAMSVLAAEGQVDGAKLAKVALIGELSLDGRVHRVPAVVGLLEVLENSEEVEAILLPQGNGWEARLVGSRKARGVTTIADVLSFLRGGELASPKLPPKSSVETAPRTTFDDIVGQNSAKRALTIALAGRHHLLMIGAPGVGKSMLASTSPALLPSLDEKEWVEVVKLHSYHPDQLPADARAPFRSPHHSISTAGLLGGGSGVVLPGEVSLAHRGVLFLDELPEFRRPCIDGLREPLQNGVIFLHRIGQAMKLSARFTFLAAMNPCPCGYRFSDPKRCGCPSDLVLRYQKRISGPILDRLDLGVVLAPPRRTGLDGAAKQHETAKAQLRRTREMQSLRTSDGLDLEKEEKAWLESLYDRGRLSFRSLRKIVGVARTIADLEQSERIRLPHLQEAKVLRCPELGTFAGL